MSPVAGHGAKPRAAGLVPATCQITDAGTQFDGAPGQGLYTFGDYRTLPRTTRIVLTLLSYSTAEGGTPGAITFFAVRVTGAPLERVLLGRATAAQMTGPGTAGNVTFCGKVLPRDPEGPDPGNQGAFWNVIALSEGKDVAASVCLDFVLEPFPDTSPEDSPRLTP